MAISFSNSFGGTTSTVALTPIQKEFVHVRCEHFQKLIAGDTSWTSLAGAIDGAAQRLGWAAAFDYKNVPVCSALLREASGKHHTDVGTPGSVEEQAHFQSIVKVLKLFYKQF
jgi:hypothetical protein